MINELDALLALIDSGDCGLLHFSCHNSFTADDGSAIAMDGGPFVPSLLNSAATRRALERRGPVVFLNACRSAGVAPEYLRLTGWAQQFMAAGAGAFVGTLWAVRSDRAAIFAHDFYRCLCEGEPLGQAALSARRALSTRLSDPTWLAYTVYGDPDATTIMRPPTTTPKERH